MRNQINQNLIDRGRSFNRLMQNEDFALFLEELDERVSRYKTLVLDFKQHSQAAELGVMHYLHRFQELADLRQWVKDEIDTGASELMRKNQMEDLAATRNGPQS